MITNTFLHIPKIGATTEQRYWQNGLRTWDDAMLAEARSVLGTKFEWVRGSLEESLEHLEKGDAKWFDDKLPSSENWRLYGQFKDRAAYVDIETTGLGMDEDHITTIALSGGGKIKTYVHGQNLEEFEDDIQAFDLLVTFNGKCFDAPFIERSFNMKLNMAHIDLRFPLKKVGHTGGLKKIEKELGLDRDELEGVDGFFAVILWREYLNTGNPAALETLLAYNAADVASLEALLAYVYNTLIAETPFEYEARIDPPQPPDNPHIPDRTLVEELMRRHGY